MNNRTLISIALFSSSICAATPVIADECDAALIRDNLSQFSSLQEKLAVLSIYDQQTHQSGSTSFSGEVSLPIEGIPIGAGSDFSDTEETKTSVFDYYSYDYSRDDAIAYIRSRLSPESANAYVECLRLTQNGLFLWFTNVTDQAATLNIRWSPPAGTAATQNLETSPQFLGTSTPASIVDPIWDFNATRSYIVDRVASSELRVVMNLGGHSGTAFIPKPPVVVIPTWTYSERIARGDRFRVAFDTGSCPDSACFIDFTVADGQSEIR